MSDAKGEIWRKIFGLVNVLFILWFLRIPIGVYLIKSVHFKRDAIKFIDKHMDAADSKIRELQVK